MLGTVSGDPLPSHFCVHCFVSVHFLHCRFWAFNVWKEVTDCVRIFSAAHPQHVCLLIVKPCTLCAAQHAQVVCMQVGPSLFSSKVAVTQLSGFCPGQKIYISNNIALARRSKGPFILVIPFHFWTKCWQINFSGTQEEVTKVHGLHSMPLSRSQRYFCLISFCPSSWKRGCFLLFSLEHAKLCRCCDAPVWVLSRPENVYQTNLRSQDVRISEPCAHKSTFLITKVHGLPSRRFSRRQTSPMDQTCQRLFRRPRLCQFRRQGPGRSGKKMIPCAGTAN